MKEVILAVIIAVSLVGCGDDTTNNSTVTNETNNTVRVTEEVVVPISGSGFVYDPYRLLSSGSYAISTEDTYFKTGVLLDGCKVFVGAGEDVIEVTMADTNYMAQTSVFDTVTNTYTFDINGTGQYSLRALSYSFDSISVAVDCWE